MCEFLSAVKTKDKNGKDKYYFLTHHLIHETPRGEMVRKRFPGIDEVIGHSAIRAYYEIRDNESENWECSDFSTSANFPAIIVKAIKRGEFRGFGNPTGLLTAPAYKVWQEATAPAYKVWQEAKATADKVWQEATAPAYKVWQEATAPADKVYQEATAPAYKVWQEAKATADKVWQEATATAFWDLFAVSENRAEVWR
jgi:vacuolar-type H+-ATPase subunit H